MSDPTQEPPLPTTETASFGETPPSSDSVPRVEGYEVTGRLGQGGMGTVWRAVQLSTHREVALKLLGSGSFATDKQRHRFEREVELASNLEHPNVARIYESGLHRGVYYYAMALIDGQPLDEYVEERKPSQREVLELMAKVCRAVQHAHQRGIIHRDLKPSNILVTKDGQPHVLDFGLAKTLLQQEQAITVSVDGELAGTPAYMSPEQASGRLHEIDTRSDVYSLGVILYRLLVGKPPHDVTGGRLEVLRRVADEGVRRPRDLNRKIGRALEALLLKALSREVERRYASAGELAQDIESYLRGDPLSAHKPSMMYFLIKRLRKYWIPVSVSALFLIVLSLRAPLWVGFVVLAAVAVIAVLAYLRVSQARRLAEEQRERAEEERAEAEKARDNATAVTAFLRETLSLADPSRTKKPDMSVREVLDLAAGEIGERFADQPESEVAVRNTVGQTYYGLGAYEAAEKQFRDAMQVGIRILGREHPETLTAMEGLGRALHRQDRREEAQEVLRETVEIRRRVLGSEHLDTARSMSYLAFVLTNHEEARGLFMEALDVQRRLLGPEHRDTLDTMEGLGLALARLGDQAGAMDLEKEILQRRQQALGNEHPDTLNSMMILVRTLSDLGELAEAERLCGETLEIDRRVLGKEHHDTLHTMESLSRILRERGKFTEAEGLLREVLEIRSRLLGGKHPDTMGTVFYLAALRREGGQDAEAEQLAREVLEIRRRTGRDPVGPMQLLSQVLIARGKYREAEDLAREALEVWERLRDKEQLVFSGLPFYLGSALAGQGRNAEAEKALREGLEQRERVFGKEHESTLFATRFLAEVLSAQGKHDEAEKLCRETLATRDHQFGREHPHTLESMDDLSVVLSAAGKHAEAEALSRETLAIRERLWGREHVWTRNTMQHLADILQAAGRRKQADEVRRSMDEGPTGDGKPE